MKIDKNNPWHWLMFVCSICMLLIAVPFRILKNRSKVKRPSVVFYGHALNGNLLALYNHWRNLGDIDCYYLLFDTQDKVSQAINDGFQVLDAMRFSDILKLVRADVFISSYGLHHFVILRLFTSIKFIDVFHAPLAFKGFDAKDFKHLHGHDQTWVSSEKVRHIYIDRYGFDAEKVKVTGGARVEDIQRYIKSVDAIKKEFDLSLDKKTILIAPTWKQDSRNRNIVPFGLSLQEFLGAILSVTSTDDIQIIFRAHINSGDFRGSGVMKNVHMFPGTSYPNIEKIIAVSDILINDWSSTAFDFMTTDNPVVFLDVEPPFSKGFSAGPEHRFGAVVKNVEELTTVLKQMISNPNKYQKKYIKSIKETKDLVFGGTLDGHTFERCDKELFSLLCEKND